MTLLYYSPHYKINHIPLLSAVEKEINMLEHSRAPSTKFEGVHAASEVSGLNYKATHAPSNIRHKNPSGKCIWT